MLNASRIVLLHETATQSWHDAQLPLPQPASPLEELVLTQHRANIDLWHQEDDARDRHATDAVIAQVKRAIDRLNQERNDFVEQIDLSLLELLSAQPADAPLHSETPGLIIDRLSILSLKIFHTAEQTQRPEVTEAHRERNRDRLLLLEEQRNDLSQCLATLWQEVLAGRRRFKLYRQFKMYNDPTLNPVLYRTSQAS